MWKVTDPDRVVNGEDGQQLELLVGSRRFVLELWEKR